MARYIDANELYEVIVREAKNQFCGELKIGKSRGLIMAMKTIKNFPAADVAPRAEVEELTYKLECLLCHATGSRLSKSTYSLNTMETAVTDYIQESIGEAEAETIKETAAEIFAEIEEIINNIGYFDELDLEALKKKYTEGKQ